MLHVDSQWNKSTKNGAQVVFTIPDKGLQRRWVFLTNSRNSFIFNSFNCGFRSYDTFGMRTALKFCEETAKCYTTLWFFW